MQVSFDIIFDRVMALNLGAVEGFGAGFQRFYF